MYKFKKIIKILFGKALLVIVFIGFLLSLFFYWGWYERQYYKGLGMYYVHKGDKAYRSRDLQKAIDYYNTALEVFPAHYGARFNLGNIFVVYEDYYSAADSYEKALEYNRNFTEARMNLGIILSEKIGDFDSAIEQYRAIINSKPRVLSIPFIFNNKKSEKINRGLAYYNMGIAYRQKALYLEDDENKQEKTVMLLRKAIESYNNAVKILNSDYDSRYNLALTYHLAGNYQRAGLSYCKAIEIEPMNYEAHYNLAILLRHLRMYPEAKEELEKASILISSKHADSYTSRYIFDILNEVTHNALHKTEYEYLLEKINDEPSYVQKAAYVHGKIVASDELDKAMIKNFRNCRTKKIFKEYE